MITTLRSRITGAAAAAIITVGALLAIASPAQAHDVLVGTELGANDAGAPTSFTLTFNNSIIEVGTEIVGTGPDGKSVLDGAAKVDGPAVTQPLTSGLKAGDYKVAWRVVSSDGHPIEGSFGLTIDAAGKGVITEPTAKAEHDDQAAESEGHTHGEGEGDHLHADGKDGEKAEKGSNPGAIWVVSASAAVAAAGAGTAAVVATRRRKAAMEQAAAEASAAGTEPKDTDSTPSA